MRALPYIAVAIATILALYSELRPVVDKPLLAAALLLALAAALAICDRARR